MFFVVSFQSSLHFLLGLFCLGAGIWDRASGGLRSFAGHLGLALVFVPGGALPGGLVSVFGGLVASIGVILDFGGGPGHCSIILWGLVTFLIFP